MTKWSKTAILAILGIIVAIILLNPNLGFVGFGSKYKKFQVTANAGEVLNKSLKQKHPVFLEFYAKW